MNIRRSWTKRSPGQKPVPRLALVLGLLAAVACSDPMEELPPPKGELCGFADEIPRCDVVTEAPEEGDPNSLADAGTTLVLPAVRVGGLAYSEQLPGSSASSVDAGALPPGLTLAGGVISGDPEPVEKATRFAFRVGELSVRLDVYPNADPELEIPKYWDCGPYATWSTAPTEGCDQDPEIPEVGGITNVDLFMTYPAVSDPTVSGDGAVATGRWPVIFWAHANHDRTCDINEGYRSLHDHWASWGYIVVAVDATAWNCMPGSTANIERRIEQVLAAVDVVEGLNQDPASRFYGRVDLERVVIAGHSRGGGASLEIADRVPGARAIIDMQGIDMTAFGFGTATVRSLPAIGFTAGSDVDLNYPVVEPTEDQLGGAYTWVNVDGGIHAYTADTSPVEPDDEPGISQQQQHDINEFYSTAFLARWIGVGDGSQPATFVPAGEADAVLFSHRGAEQVRESISERGVHTRWNRRIVGYPLSLDAPEVFTYTPDENNPRPLYRKAVSYRLEPGEYSISLAEGSFPLTAGAGATLQGRVKGPDRGMTSRFEVDVVTAAGTTTLSSDEILGPVPVYNRFTQLAATLPEGEVSSMVLRIHDGVLFVDDLRIE
jgi:hypothetical protein